jgi:hypothetical protein
MVHLNHTTDVALIDSIATKVVERIFAPLKPSVAQYPNGVQIGSIFLAPIEDGRYYRLSAEVQSDSDSDEDPSATPLEMIEDAYTIPWAITRAIVLQLEHQILIASFDVVREEEQRESRNADQGR